MRHLALLLPLLLACDPPTPPDVPSTDPGAAATGGTGEGSAPVDDTRPEGIPAACYGERLDLGKLFASEECDVAGPAMPTDPATIKASLSPAPLSMASGASGKVTMWIKNATGKPLVLDVNVGCKELGAHLFKAQARSGKEVVCGGLGMSCTPRILRVGVTSSGSLMVDLPVVANAGLDADDCPDDPKAPLAAGTYNLEADTRILVAPDAETDKTLLAKGVLRLSP